MTGMTAARYEVVIAVQDGDSIRGQQSALVERVEDDVEESRLPVEEIAGDASGPRCARRCDRAAGRARPQSFISRSGLTMREITRQILVFSVESSDGRPVVVVLDRLIVARGVPAGRGRAVRRPLVARYRRGPRPCFPRCSWLLCLFVLRLNESAAAYTPRAQPPSAPVRFSYDRGLFR